MESNLILPGHRDYSIPNSSQRRKRKDFIPGSIKPEHKYDELAALSAELGVPVAPMMFVNVQATNPDGSEGEQYYDRSRTYNRNFWNSILGWSSSIAPGTQTFGSGFLATKDTSAVVQTTNWGFAYNGGASINANSLLGLINDDNVGIQVGTGTTAESFEHTGLATKILQGNTSGKLTYNAQNATTSSYNSGTKVWTLTLVRIFNNNSGGTIVVAETGICMRQASYSSFNAIFFIERSLLGATVSVLNAGQLTVTYTMTLTFPA